MDKGYSFFRALGTILITAAAAAGILIFFSPNEDYSRNSLFAKPESTIEVTPTEPINNQERIGLIAGHWGYDTGHSCGPEFQNVKESDVDLLISVMVRDYLNKKGYNVDLLNEFDPKLNDYTALALLDIHTNTCDYVNNSASGFRIAPASNASYPAENQRLDACIVSKYSEDTNMEYLGDQISSDDRKFYDFSKINSYTTVSVMEIGYLNLDYRTLSERTDDIVRGIGDGLICYIKNEKVNTAVLNHVQTIATESPMVQTKFILPGIEGIKTAK